MRFASAMRFASGLEVVAQRLGFGHVQGAFVDRPAGDGADDPRGAGVQQLLDVAEIVDAAGGVTGIRVALASAAVASTLQPCIMPSLEISV